MNEKDRTRLLDFEDALRIDHIGLLSHEGLWLIHIIHELEADNARPRGIEERLPFRVLLDWFMVSDPWPLDEGRGVIEAWLNREAGAHGWVDWIQAYHEEPPAVLGEGKEEQ